MIDIILNDKAVLVIEEVQGIRRTINKKFKIRFISGELDYYE